EFARALLAEIDLQPLGDGDRLGPVAHHLRDLQAVVQRGGAITRALEPVERVLGTVDQAGAQVVLAELEERVLALLGVEVAPLDQVLVDPDRPVGLAPTPEQVAEGEMQLDRLGIDLHHVDEGVDRLVGLLVEEEVESAEVGVRHVAAAVGLARLEAGREPAEDEEERDGEQPPGVEGHLARSRPARLPGRNGPARTGRSGASLTDAQPPTRGGTAAESGGSTSDAGADESRASRRRSSVTVVFEGAKPSATRKSSRLKIQATTRIERLRAQALCAESARGLHPGIDPLAKVLAGLEVGNPFLRHHDLLAGLGIATDP